MTRRLAAKTQSVQSSQELSGCLPSTLPLAAMSSADDYDKLTPEEREARDKADRAREAAEQAGAVL